MKENMMFLEEALEEEFSRKTISSLEEFSRQKHTVQNT